MSSADALKRDQEGQWDSRAAVRLERAELIERHWSSLNDELLRLCGLGPGQRLLDVGTGHGEPAMTAATIVGERGRVVGSDISAEMIEVARVRARRAGVAGIEWVVEDAERLTHDAESFDAIVCRQCLMFLPDPVRGLAEMHRVLVPGGTAAIVVVGPASTQPQWTMTMGAIVDALGATAPPQGRVGEPGVYSVSDVALLARLMGEAGFDDVEVFEQDYVWDYASPQEMVAWHQINPTIMGLFDGRSEQDVQRAWDAVVAAAAPRADADGRVRFPSTMLYATGRRG